MNPAGASKEILEDAFVKSDGISCSQQPWRPTILIATLDPEIRNGLSEILPHFSLNTVWVKSAADARSVLASTQIAAVFCEIWLQGGTCRELIWYMRRKAADLPIVIVPPPNCPKEYREWLAALNTNALYFLPYPYRESDLKRLVRMAIGFDSLSVRQ